MLSVIVGLVGALIFGAADFLGGMASKRISSIRVTALAAGVGLIALLLALPLIGGVWSMQAVLYGALSGVTGAGAIVLLYACLAIGPMSILSPLTAVVSAIVPMTAGLVRGERLEPIGYLALGIALIAVVLVGFVPEKDAVRPSAKSLVMAVASGTLIGAFLILIDLTPDDSGLVPLIANRATNAAIMFAAVGVIAVVTLRSRRSLAEPVNAVGAWRPGLLLAISCGILDAAANALLLLGLRLGELTVMSVLTAMYSAGTIILAAIVLREKLTAVQIAGLALALIAAGMLALA
ncbi:MAG: hypothetical protein JWP30_1675 [Homoserinimonas sp.]|nr:hypothetical protein [Homoserinimonas sp.]